MATVWNPADATSHWTLSNTDHTASLNSVPSFTNEGIRSIGLTRSTGKWYLEFTSILSGGSAGRYGFAASGDTLGDVGQCGVSPNGTIFGPAGSVSLGATPDGTTLSIAIDLTNLRIWCRLDAGNWNNSPTANPSTNTGGLDITGVTTPLYLHIWEQSFAAGHATVNAGDNAFVQTVPSGFTPWDQPGASGSFDTTEATDTLAAIGYVGIPGIRGDLLVTEAKDAFAAAGYQPNSGVLATFEAADHFSAFGYQPLTGTLVVTEARDIMHATGIGLGEDGVFIVTEAPGIMVAVGATPISGSFVTTEVSDRFFALGAGATRVRRRRTLIVT